MGTSQFSSHYRYTVINIFVTHPDPVISAWSLDDKRVIKMILESAQLLSTALFLHKGEIAGLYKPSHINHPCTKWVARNQSNFGWLTEHAFALCCVYQTAYDKRHKSSDVIELAAHLIQYLPPGELSSFENCTPFKDRPDIINNYKQYLNSKWDSDKLKPTWKNRVPPIFKSPKVLH